MFLRSAHNSTTQVTQCERSHAEFFPVVLRRGAGYGVQPRGHRGPASSGKASRVAGGVVPPRLGWGVGIVTALCLRRHSPGSLLRISKQLQTTSAGFAATSSEGSLLSS